VIARSSLFLSTNRLKQHGIRPILFYCCIRCNFPVFSGPNSYSTVSGADPSPAPVSVGGQLTVLHIQNAYVRNCRHNWLRYATVFGFRRAVRLQPPELPTRATPSNPHSTGSFWIRPSIGYVLHLSIGLTKFGNKLSLFRSKAENVERRQHSLDSLIAVFTCKLKWISWVTEEN